MVRREYSFGQVEVSTQPAPPTIQIRGTTISDYQEYSGSLPVYRLLLHLPGSEQQYRHLQPPAVLLGNTRMAAPSLIELKNGTYQVTIPNYQPTLWE